MPEFVLDFTCRLICFDYKKEVDGMVHIVSDLQVISNPRPEDVKSHSRVLQQSCRLWLLLDCLHLCLIVS